MNERRPGMDTQQHILRAPEGDVKHVRAPEAYPQRIKKACSVTAATLLNLKIIYNYNYKIKNLALHLCQFDFRRFLSVFILAENQLVVNSLHYLKPKNG